MDNRGIQTYSVRWSILSAALAFFLHIGPIWFLLFGPLYGLPNVLELDLESINSYRERVFRELAARRAFQGPSPAALHISVSVPSHPELAEKISRPRKEEDLVRARAVQRAIRSLWEGMPAEQTGYALVSLNIRDDGSIGEYVVNRVAGGEEFQAFLFAFLTSLKASYGNQAGPGEPMWIECEFVVKPMANKRAS